MFGEGRAFDDSFREGLDVTCRSQLSILTGDEKTTFIRQLAESGAGRGRRGTAEKGGLSNITLDMCT